MNEVLKQTNESQRRKDKIASWFFMKLNHERGNFEHETEIQSRDRNSRNLSRLVYGETGIRQI